MSAAALLLVLVSAGAHALWNFLMKRALGASAGTRPFVALSKACEAVVFLPAFVAVAWRQPPGSMAAVAPYAAVGTLLVLASYATLGAAYRHGDLAFAYPIARGGMLLFLPPMGWLAFGERVGPLGWAAVALIVAGVCAMQLPALSAAGLRTLGRRLTGAPALLALLMALLLAAGAVWDKHAVRRVPLFAYFYAYTAGAAVCYAAATLRADGPRVVRATWAAHGRAAAAVGVLSMTSYGLALAALRAGGSTYVVGLRQLSIAAGVWLGVRYLGERFDAPRRAGVALIVAGCLLMAAGR